jgi:imidazole glycerol-phosphate synthase subunit HisF
MRKQINNYEASSKTPFSGRGGNPYKQGGMFEGASHLIFENAKKLRRNMTAAETFLWQHLRAGLNGFKFRRQHPIGLYIADFYCHKVRLIIEVDGSIHNLSDIKDSDELREGELMKWGYTAIRFTNEQVMKTAEEVLKIISEKMLELNNLQKQNTLL